MKNKEKYSEEIVELSIAAYGMIAVDEITGKPARCFEIGCENCAFSVRKSGERCSEALKEWAEAEYKEPITRDRLEKEYIRFLETKNGIAHQSVTKYLSETKYYCSMCLEWLLDHYNVTEKEADNG